MKERLTGVVFLARVPAGPPFFAVLGSDFIVVEHKTSKISLNIQLEWATEHNLGYLKHQGSWWYQFEGCKMSEIVDIKKMKVAELREELKARGLESKGNKPQLVKRLEKAIAAAAGGT